METRWEYNFKKSAFSISIHPHPSMLGNAFADFIRYLALIGTAWDDFDVQACGLEEPGDPVWDRGGFSKTSGGFEATEHLQGGYHQSEFHLLSKLIILWQHYKSCLLGYLETADGRKPWLSTSTKRDQEIGGDPHCAGLRLRENPRHSSPGKNIQKYSTKYLKYWIVFACLWTEWSDKNIFSTEQWYSKR